MNKVIEKNYEIDLRLSVIYEVLDKFYTPFCNDFPKEISLKIADLLDAIGKNIYPCNDGYDIVSEKHYITIAYRKCGE